MRVLLWLGMFALFLAPLLAMLTMRGLTAAPHKGRSTDPSTDSPAFVTGRGARQSHVRPAVGGQARRLCPTNGDPRALSTPPARAGMDPIADASGDRSTRLPSSSSSSGLVQSLEGLDGALKRHKVVERLVPGGPPRVEGGLVDSLQNLDRVLKKHGVVEKVVPRERSAPPAGGLTGSLRKLGRVVDDEVLPLLERLPAAP